MRFFVRSIIGATSIILLIATSVPALPPQVKALNDFIENDQYLSDKNCCFRAVTDLLHKAVLVYYRPTWNYYEQKDLKYLSFDLTGNLRVAEQTVLQEVQGLSLNQNESMVIPDSHSNIHLVMRDDRRSLDRPLQTYVMIDSLGSLKKRIEFDEPFLLSSMLVLGDGTLVIHGVSGSLNKVVLVSGEDTEKFESFSVRTPESDYRLANARGQIYDLGKDRILYLSLYSSPYMGKTLIRAIIINLVSRAVVDAEILDARKAASIFYYNKVQNISYVHNRIFPVGDKIAYLCGLPSMALPYVPSDSMCVILFDSQGKLVKSEWKESYPIETGVLNSFDKNDFLIMNNRDAFGDYRSTGENRLSLYGLMSLRNFPRIIIDPGLE